MAGNHFTPFWGHPTSTLDWCEENYKVLPYIAEFWNTVSNLALILPCFVGLYNCYTASLEWRFVFSFLGLLIVGIGSWLFHMTLLWHYQLVDELSMIYASCIFMFCIVDARVSAGSNGLLLSIALLVYAVLVTYFYIRHKAVLFHQTSYALQVAGIMFFAYLKSRAAPPHIRALFPIALASYVFAFLLWNIDNQLCGTLQFVRAYLGIFAPVVQLHAWWHIGVGIGSYLYIVFGIAARMQELKRRVNISSFAGLPIIAPETKTS
eukprot:m.210858 g.210858  ORF g.210858 m.210858 type:complete len:264 (+) comp16940_c4_seq3:1588-2379(+)